MNHEQARQRWHDCTDQGRSDPKLEVHLRECASCRDYVRDMETVLRVLDTARRETERIEGSAVDFCHVVTQGRNVADTRLGVRGEVSTLWMSIAQCFAGGAVDPPKPGSRGPKSGSKH